MENLWPEFGEITNVTTPGMILKEQAKALGETFQNKIRGTVSVDRDSRSFSYKFRLVCPPLNYIYRLFDAEYGLIDFYPVRVTVVGDIAEEICGTKEETVIEAPNEEKFKAVLSQIFSAKKTKNVIRALRIHLE